MLEYIQTTLGYEYENTKVKVTAIEIDRYMLVKQTNTSTEVLATKVLLEIFEERQEAQTPQPFFIG